MARVTLTFDNGPDTSVTPFVLETLQKRGLTATFFVIGSKAATDDNMDIVRRAFHEGHWIGNHTYSHGTPFGELEDPQDAVREIRDTAAVLGSIAGSEKLFRPFGGGGHLDHRLLNRCAVEHLVSQEYTCVIWNNVPRDWERPDAWTRPALETVRDQRWSVIVLHDFVPVAMRHLPDFLDRLLDEGHQIVQSFPSDCTPIQRGRITVESLQEWMPAD